MFKVFSVQQFKEKMRKKDFAENVICSSITSLFYCVCYTYTSCITSFNMCGTLLDHPADFV